MALELKMECRICRDCDLNELVDMFDPNLEGLARHRRYIEAAAGVKIIEDDIVSKSVCNKCLKVTYNMYIFRINALRNDEIQKAEIQQMLDQNDVQIIENTDILLPKAEVLSSENMTKKLSPVNDVEVSEKSNVNLPAIVEVVPCKDKKKKTSFSESTPPVQQVMHPSVEKILALYTDLQIPTGCYLSDFCPVIKLEKTLIPKIALRYSCSPLSKEMFASRLDLAPVDSLLDDTGTDKSLLSIRKTNSIYVCDTCNSLFDTKKKLRVHSKSHFTCKFCSTSFSKSSLLKAHIKVCEYRINVSDVSKNDDRVPMYRVKTSSETNLKITLNKENSVPDKPIVCKTSTNDSTCNGIKLKRKHNGDDLSGGGSAKIQKQVKSVNSVKSAPADAVVPNAEQETATKPSERAKIATLSTPVINCKILDDIEIVNVTEDVTPIERDENIVKTAERKSTSNRVLGNNVSPKVSKITTNITNVSNALPDVVMITDDDVEYSVKPLSKPFIAGDIVVYEIIDDEDDVVAAKLISNNVARAAVIQHSQPLEVSTILKEVTSSSSALDLKRNIEPALPDVVVSNDNALGHKGNETLQGVQVLHTATDDAQLISYEILDNDGTETICHKSVIGDAEKSAKTTKVSTYIQATQQPAKKSTKNVLVDSRVVNKSPMNIEASTSKSVINPNSTWVPILPEVVSEADEILFIKNFFKKAKKIGISKHTHISYPEILPAPEPRSSQSVKFKELYRNLDWYKIPVKLLPDNTINALEGKIAYSCPRSQPNNYEFGTAVPIAIRPVRNTEMPPLHRVRPKSALNKSEDLTKTPEPVKTRSNSCEPLETFRIKTSDQRKPAVATNAPSAVLTKTPRQNKFLNELLNPKPSNTFVTSKPAVCAPVAGPIDNTPVGIPLRSKPLAITDNPPTGYLPINKRPGLRPSYDSTVVKTSNVNSQAGKSAIGITQVGKPSIGDAQVGKAPIANPTVLNSHFANLTQCKKPVFFAGTVAAHSAAHGNPFVRLPRIGNPVYGQYPDGAPIARDSPAPCITNELPVTSNTLLNCNMLPMKTTVSLDPRPPSIKLRVRNPWEINYPN